MPRILLTGDQLLIRTAIARLIAAEPGLEIAGECANSAEAVAEAMKAKPDVVVMDLDLNARGLVHLLAAAKPGPVLILADSDQRRGLADALAHGAMGVVLKSRTPEVLMRAIRGVLDGETWLEQSTIAHMFQQAAQHTDAAPPVNLTRREREIIELVSLGLKNKAIGQRLFISETTVRHHLTSIFNKLAVTNRLELMRYTYSGRVAAVDREGRGAPGDREGRLPFGDRDERRPE